jgi:hypothetical protein
VLPVGRGGDGFLLALPNDEAFWIGLVVHAGGRGQLTIAVELVDGVAVELGRYQRQGTFVIPGVPRPDGLFDVFCPATISHIRLGGAAEMARIGLAGVEDFVARTGRDPPAPFDPAAAYGGWRLP